MSAASEIQMRVPDLDIKLSDCSNYLEWVRMLRIFLSMYQLDEIVDGDILKPIVSETAIDTTTTKSTIRTDSKKWQRVNDKALGFIIVNTKATACSIILMETDANIVWERLRWQYEGKI